MKNYDHSYNFYSFIYFNLSHFIISKYWNYSFYWSYRPLFELTYNYFIFLNSVLSLIISNLASKSPQISNSCSLASSVLYLNSFAFCYLSSYICIISLKYGSWWVKCFPTLATSFYFLLLWFSSFTLFI